METKEKVKAKELFYKMIYFYPDNEKKIQRMSSEKAKQCALIAVDEVLDTLGETTYNCEPLYLFWMGVRVEITNL